MILIYWKTINSHGENWPKPLASFHLFCDTHSTLIQNCKNNQLWLSMVVISLQLTKMNDVFFKVTLMDHKQTLWIAFAMVHPIKWNQCFKGSFQHLETRKEPWSFENLSWGGLVVAFANVQQIEHTSLSFSPSHYLQFQPLVPIGMFDVISTCICNKWWYWYTS